MAEGTRMSGAQSVFRSEGCTKFFFGVKSGPVAGCRALVGSGSTMNILNNWKILELITREGETLVCIEGRVYGSNPRFPSSSHIRTSPVTGYSLESNSMVVTTKRGSEYLLGKPDPSETFAQQRLIRRLSRLRQSPPSKFNELESQLTEYNDRDSEKDGEPLGEAERKALEEQINSFLTTADSR
jgi:hypothetical protein